VASQAAIRADDASAVALEADVRDCVSSQQAVDRAVEASGGANVPVNNAGMFLAGPISRVTFEYIPDEDWDRPFPSQ
jgi:NAD(P)-dependent dehydrogenase (short-subunit alcohol dehydrogenase family)